MGLANMKLEPTRRNFLGHLLGATTLLLFPGVKPQIITRVHTFQAQGVDSAEELRMLVLACSDRTHYLEGYAKFIALGGCLHFKSDWNPTNKSLICYYEFDNQASWSLWKKELVGFFDKKKFESIGGNLNSETSAGVLFRI